MTSQQRSDLPFARQPARSPNSSPAVTCSWNSTSECWGLVGKLERILGVMWDGNSPMKEDDENEDQQDDNYGGGNRDSRSEVAFVLSVVHSH